MSLVARYLEENGYPTVIIGAARDIVEHCGVPRFVFTDFPLGSPCGQPFDAAMQRQIVGTALDLLESATTPRTTVEVPVKWPAGDDWKAKVFTPEQPFLPEGAQERWIAKKEAYRRQKAQEDGKA